MLMGLLLMLWGMSETGAGAQGITLTDVRSMTQTANAPTAWAIGTIASGYMTQHVPNWAATPTRTAPQRERVPDLVLRIERARIRYDADSIVIEVWYE